MTLEERLKNNLVAYTTIVFVTGVSFGYGGYDFILNKVSEKYIAREVVEAKYVAKEVVEANYVAKHIYDDLESKYESLQVQKTASIDEDIPSGRKLEVPEETSLKDTSFSKSLKDSIDFRKEVNNSSKVANAFPKIITEDKLVFRLLSSKIENGRLTLKLDITNNYNSNIQFGLYSGKSNGNYQTKIVTGGEVYYSSFVRFGSESCIGACSTSDTFSDHVPVNAEVVFTDLPSDISLPLIEVSYVYNSGRGYQFGTLKYRNIPLLN